MNKISKNAIKHKELDHSDTKDNPRSQNTKAPILSLAKSVLKIPKICLPPMDKKHLIVFQKKVQIESKIKIFKKKNLGKKRQFGSIFEFMESGKMKKQEI